MARDPHLIALSALLMLTGLPLSLFLVLAPLAGLRVALFGLPPGDADDFWILAVVLPLTFAMGVVGAAQVGTAVGLWRQRPWAWVAGLVHCGLWIMGGLLPLGAYGLFVLLRSSARERFA